MLSDQIRSFVNTTYIVPAKRAHSPTVTIRAGDVHSEMKLAGRMPAVCGAIGAQKFEQEYNIRLIRREGPSNGANVYFTFEV